MTKIRDEWTEHREGQRIFTARRVIFALTLIAAAGFLTGWILWRES